MQQLNLMFEPGLAQRSRCLRDHLAARIYHRGLVATAGQLDMAPSKLTEKLAGCDSGGKVRGMTIDELETYVERTGDVSPVHYLIDKYLRDPDIAQREAQAKLTDLLEQLPALLAAAAQPMPKAGRARR